VGHLPLLRFILVAAAASAGILVVFAPGAIAFLLPALIGLLGLIELTKSLWGQKEDPPMFRRILWWTLVAFATHLAIGGVITVSPSLTLYAGPDAVGYQQGALQLLASWHGNVPAPYLPVSKEGFYYLLAGIYWLLGVHPLAGVAVNSFFSAAIVPIAADTTDRLFGTMPARHVAMLSAILPGFLLWPGQLLREAGILFLLAVAANAVVRLTGRATLLRVLVFGIACAFMFIVRGNVAVMATTGFLGAMIFGRRSLSSGLAVALVGFACIVAFAVLISSSAALRDLFAQANLSQVDAVRGDLAGAGSSFASTVNISTPAAALRFLPFGVVDLLLGPFPSAGASARQAVGVADAAVMWFLVPSLVRGIRIGWWRTRRRVATVLFPAMAVAALLGLLLGNYGIAVRERPQVLVLLLPLLGLGLATRRRASVEPPAASAEPAEESMPVPAVAGSLG
jgi:hypothetical protein